MAKKHVLCTANEIPAGGKKIIKVGTRKIGVFNEDGKYYAMLDTCPHHGASICEGPICGTNMPVNDYRYEFGLDGEVIRCSRHGWEFKIKTGECIGDPKIRAKTYPVTVEEGQLTVTV